MTPAERAREIVDKIVDTITRHLPPGQHITTSVYTWRREDFYAEVAAVLARLEREAAQTERRACPCLHTTPCHDCCTCVNPFSSSGCRRCCSYGNADQQRAKAEYLVAEAAQTRALREAAELVVEARQARATPNLLMTKLELLDDAIDTLRAALTGALREAP